MVDVTDLPILELVTATGALGVAAFAAVDILKSNWLWIGTQGWERIKEGMGCSLYETLSRAYGGGVDALIRRQYVSGDQEALKHTLRQGFRVGITSDIAARLAEDFGVDRTVFEDVAKKLAIGEKLTEVENSILARFEFAADARVDAAVARARQTYQGRMQLLAMIFSLVCAVFTGIYMREKDLVHGPVMLTSVLVGLTAVPLAPISKDVAVALNSVANVLRKRAG